MNSADKIKQFFKDAELSINSDSDEKIFEDIFQAQQNTIKNTPAAPENISIVIMKNTVVKAAVAAVIFFVVFMGLNQLGNSISFTSVAWADVVNKFQSVKFFNATIYFKENASEEPMQIEIWRNSSQKARIRVDSQVLFAESDKIIAGFNFEDKLKLSEDEYNENGVTLVRNLFKVSEFSINTVVQSVRGTGLEEITPLINSNAMISQDMLVFDVQSKVSPEWMRIWALRESKLPTQIRMWDPRDGECVDILITYSNEQSDNFFDPNEYEKILLDNNNFTRGNNLNLAYALLADPGGRDYVPKELFEKTGGYHMPQIEQIGITEYGAVWVMASKSRNRRPDGNIFFGFSKITDDLGRNYSSRASIWRIDDISVQVFIPDGYPFDERKPDEITLHCKVANWHPDEPEELIGTVDLNDWEPNSLWPQERLNKAETDIMLSKASGRAGSGKYDEALQIIELVEQLNPYGKYTHDIARIHLNMLIGQKKFEEADELAEKLWPQEIEIFLQKKANASYRPFIDYIIAVAGNGRIDRAAQLFEEIRTTEPDLSQYNPSQRKNILTNFQEIAYDMLGNEFTYPLFDKANLTLEQVNQILGFNVLENDETKWYVPQKYRLANDPYTISLNKHLEELVEYYKAHPLEPGQIECRKGSVVRSGFRYGAMQGLDDYKLWQMNTAVTDFAVHYNYSESPGRFRFEGDFNDVSLQYDIISRGDVSDKEQVAAVLAEVGIEIIESEDDCTVWIAEYNGQEIKDFTDVRSPVLRGSTDTPGMSSFMTSAGLNIDSLLSGLARNQNVVVEDNTGIDKDTKLSLEVPNFKTQKGAELAKQWYEENFGITFKIEQRRMKVWIVRKAQ